MLHRSYGSIDGYLDFIGISLSTRRALRELLTEPAPAVNIELSK
jgi:hypothetical protein